MTAEFKEFEKIPRLNREVVITEKIDGTNACVIVPEDENEPLVAQSRNRLIYPGSDNFAFALWVERNSAELRKLGPGHHFGEWWGVGIGRGYDQTERKFHLFNAGRWTAENVPACVGVVPILARGMLNEGVIDRAVADLRHHGSLVAPGFMRPEGVIVYHTASRQLYKVLMENDGGHKGG